MYTMIPLKWPLTLRLLPFSGRHFGFPVDSILTLNAAFRSRTIFKKSHKYTALHLSWFQRYAEKSGLGDNFTPPPVGHRRVKSKDTVTLGGVRLREVK